MTNPKNLAAFCGDQKKKEQCAKVILSLARTSNFLKSEDVDDELLGWEFPVDSRLLNLESEYGLPAWFLMAAAYLSFTMPPLKVVAWAERLISGIPLGGEMNQLWPELAGELLIGRQCLADLLSVQNWELFCPLSRLNVAYGNFQGSEGFFLETAKDVRQLLKRTSHPRELAALRALYWISQVGRCFHSDDNNVRGKAGFAMVLAFRRWAFAMLHDPSLALNSDFSKAFEIIAVKFCSTVSWYYTRRELESSGRRQRGWS